MAPDISVIIAAKDRLWSLSRAVESARSSSVTVEIIVADDNSRDGTWDWLQQQVGVTAIQAEGWGQTWAINKALGIATGKYVRFLDSDDWLNEGANERQFEIAEQREADVVVAGMENYRDDAFLSRSPWIRTDDFVALQLGEGPSSHYGAYLFRREFVKDIPHRSNYAAYDFAVRADRCFILEVSLRNPVVAIDDAFVLCHRHHKRARLQFRGGMREVATNIQHLYVYRQILELLKQRHELTPRRRKAACKVLWPLAHWIAYSHPKEGAEVADWIYQLAPEFVPPEKGLLGFLYRRIGFRATEKVLSLRRHLVGAK